MRAGLTGLVFILCGCFSPGLGDEPFLCGDTEPRCPPGYSCSAASRHCLRNGAPGPDAHLFDAPVITFDAPVADAPPPPDASRPDSRFDAAPCVSRCEGDVAVTCDPQGQSVMTSCPAGCDGGSSPVSCFVLLPSLLPATTCKDPAPPGPQFAGGTVRIDTKECTGGEVRAQQNGAPELCIFRYASLNLPAGTTLRLEGTRVAVFVSTGNMIVAGVGDGSGNADVGGPGAIVGANEQGGNGLAMSLAGGGGGGGVTMGAIGGASVNVDPGRPGPAHPSDNSLRAGGFGGAGGDRCGFAGCPTHGGGGGGAIYLVACGTLQVSTGVIDVSGGGGPGGEEGNLQQLAGGGDGGGAGGDIFVEASQVVFGSNARIGATGGGGGGGGTRGDGTIAGVHGNPGGDGSASTVKAAGGKAAVGGGQGGDGGIGSQMSSQPTPGLTVADGAVGSAGGGGGAAGRIRFLTRQDRPITFPTGLVISPTPTTGVIQRTH